MNNDSTSTAVYLNQTDATLFVAFQKRYAFVQLLESVGAFNIRSGSLTIHFDNIGQIASVDKHEHFKL